MVKANFTGVIFIAGQIAVGKTTLAVDLSKYLDCPIIDADAIKLAVYRTFPEYEGYMKSGKLIPNEYRLRAYNAISESIENLAAEYSVIIVDENLYVASLRPILYNAAQKSFGAYKIILVTAPEKIILEQLQNKRIGHTLNDPVATYLALKNMFEPMPEADFVISNNGSTEKLFQETLEFLNED